MKNKIKIFNRPGELAYYLSQQLQDIVNSHTGDFFLSISGGSTPVIFFDQLAQDPFNNGIEWSKLNIFWCDERCVVPDSPESNFGAAKKYLFDNVNIPPQNIHRIKGEANPAEEVIRYTKEIEKVLPEGENKFPRFDWIMLGMGKDGHTASLFPGENLISVQSNIAGIAQHPVTGQQRISLTAEIINNARRITFLVTGKEKSQMLSEIFKEDENSKNYPAAYIKPLNGNLDWMIDKEAAFYL